MSPALTASLSFSTPAAKDWSGGEAALVHLGQPTIEAFSQALMEHLNELLDQIIGQIDFGMELTKHEQGLLLFNTQFFQSTQKKENRMPCKHRRTRKRRGSFGILPSFWKQANQLLIHCMIRVGVAIGDQFPMQLSNIVAACFPASGEFVEMGIKRGLSRARLLFGKGGTFQPARDRGMAYPNLLSNSGLAQALFP